MSKEYVIMTDSSCDLPQELADQLGALRCCLLRLWRTEKITATGWTGGR